MQDAPARSSPRPLRARLRPNPAADHRSMGGPNLGQNLGHPPHPLRRGTRSVLGHSCQRPSANHRRARRVRDSRRACRGPHVRRELGDSGGAGPSPPTSWGCTPKSPTQPAQQWKPPWPSARSPWRPEPETCCTRPSPTEPRGSQQHLGCPEHRVEGRHQLRVEQVQFHHGAVPPARHGFAELAQPLGGQGRDHAGGVSGRRRWDDHAQHGRVSVSIPRLRAGL
jgi:hypothetical protein